MIKHQEHKDFKIYRGLFFSFVLLTLIVISKNDSRLVIEQDDHGIASYGLQVDVNAILISTHNPEYLNPPSKNLIPVLLAEKYENSFYSHNHRLKDLQSKFLQIKPQIYIPLPPRLSRAKEIPSFC